MFLRVRADQYHAVEEIVGLSVHNINLNVNLIFALANSTNSIATDWGPVVRKSNV